MATTRNFLHSILLQQGYQITQYWRPVAEDGCLEVPATGGSENSGIRWKRVRIERVQIEQDSGKSLHDSKEKMSLIDLNRAGDLMLLVMLSNVEVNLIFDGLCTVESNSGR